MRTQAAGRSSSPSWTPDLASGFIVACSLVLAATVVVGRGVSPSPRCSSSCRSSSPGIGGCFTWHVLLCFVIAVVLFVPVGRYSMAIHLPFGLELYRVAVALVLLVWVASLLVDPTVRLRRTPLDAPVALIVAASLGSVAVNNGRVAPLAAAVLKGVTLFLSFIIFFYFISSVVTTLPASSRSRSSSCPASAVVAFFAIIEQRTGFNVFDHVRASSRSCIRRVDNVGPVRTDSCRRVG